MVAGPDVFEHLVIVHFHALFFHLAEAAVGSFFGRGLYKNFHFGIGKYGRAYVATVHHDSFVFAEFLLQSDQTLAYLRYFRHRTDKRADLHVTDLGFHVVPVKQSVLHSV